MGIEDGEINGINAEASIFTINYHIYTAAFIEGTDEFVFVDVEGYKPENKFGYGVKLGFQYKRINILSGLAYYQYSLNESVEKRIRRSTYGVPIAISFMSKPISLFSMSKNSGWIVSTEIGYEVKENVVSILFSIGYGYGYKKG